MQFLTVFKGFLVAVTIYLTALLIFLISNARKQHFSESRFLDKDEEDTLSYDNDNVKLYRNHEDLLSDTARGNRKFYLVLSCPSKNVMEVRSWGVQSCTASCTKHEDCEGNGYKCSCDRPCGLTCNKIAEAQKKNCEFPGQLENGRVLLVGKLGLYDYEYKSRRFSHNQKIIFECALGYSLALGPTGKTCRNGLWLPTEDNPQCVKSDKPTISRVRHTMKKRRVLKTGAAVLARGSGGGGGGGGKKGSGGERRDDRRNWKWSGRDDDVEIGAMECPNLDYEPFMLVEMIKMGADYQNMYSEGAVANINCIPGFAVNLSNKTVICQKGKWRPKLPRCSELSCKVPYVAHGTLYDGSGMPLFFQKLKPQGAIIKLKCSKGYMPVRPTASKLKCLYGEWEVEDAPECVPDSRIVSSHSRKACGNPPVSKLAIAYLEGIPIEHKITHRKRFQHGTEIMYRCEITRPRKSIHRWKITCKNGTWNVATVNSAKCDRNVTVKDQQEAYEIAKFINRDCTYHRTDKNVVSFHNNKEIVNEQADFATGSLLVSRCVDIGKFQLKGAQRRKCISGQWMGLTPKCEGLSQYHDYNVHKSPTILFRFVNGSVSQTVDGKLSVYPGTTLHMDCLYLRRFGTPSWSVSLKNRQYVEGWTDGIPGRDHSLEYRLTIDNATKSDTGLYACSTPTRHIHSIYINVEKVDCEPLPTREDLVYSINFTAAGTRVFFHCKDNNSQLVGNTDVQCEATGVWNRELPWCETIKCPNASLAPAMAPLADMNITDNNTLCNNGTAPRNVASNSRDDGSKISFSKGNTKQCVSPTETDANCDIPPEPENEYMKGTVGKTSSREKFDASILIIVVLVVFIVTALYCIFVCIISIL